MPRTFPLTGFPKQFIPTAPNHFVDIYVDEIIDHVLFKQLQKPVSKYPAVIAANSFVNEFEPETAVKLIDNFHKTKLKRRRVEYFKEVYCRNKILREFIKLKPTCFLVIGIPCEKHYHIGEAFAKKLSHVHVNVLDLINDEMAKRTDVGRWIYTNLKMGKDIPITLILQLLTKALKHPDVMNRGYVLTSFPILPFKKFSRNRLPIQFDDMMSLEEPSIEECQKWLKERVKVIKFPGDTNEDLIELREEERSEQSSSESDTESDESDRGFQEEAVEYKKDTIPIESSSVSEESESELAYDLSLHEIINDKRLLNDLCEQDVIYSVRKQFDTLMRLDLPPDIVVFFPQNEDGNFPCRPTESRHTKEGVEEAAFETTFISSSDKAFFNEMSSSASTTISTDSFISSSLMSEDFSDGFFEDRRLGMADNGFPLYVKRFLSIKDEMEQFILHYSKDMVIKIDDRCCVKEALEQLEIRMKFINYKYVNEAVPQFPDGIDTNLRDKLSKCKTTEEVLGLACQSETIDPSFLWRKGSFMTKCPVKLHQGKIAEGKINFAVRFLGYIHFLSSFSAMKMFIRDPCKYFICKPNCRIAIVGARIPSITSVIKSMLNCTEYDWKDNEALHNIHHDIYKEATEWADTVIENIDVPGLDNKYYNKPRGLTNVLQVFHAAAEKLLNILTEDVAPEEDFDPADMFSVIGLDSQDQDLVEMLRLMFNEKERQSQISSNFRASLKAAVEIPFSEIVDTLVNEKFNEIFKSRYSKQIAIEVSRWIREQDHQIAERTHGKQKYARWLINDVPTDIQFWRYLAKHDTLPDVVIIFHEQSPIKLYDLYSRRTTQLKDIHQIASYIINNNPVLFHEAECMLAKIEAERHTESKPMNPLEQLLSGVEVNVGRNEDDSLEELEKFLNRKKVIYVKQNMREHTLTTASAAVIQKYFEVFKTKPLLQSAEHRNFLNEMNNRFEKMSINVGKCEIVEYLETFKLSLAHVDTTPFDSEDEQVQSVNIEYSGGTIDLAEVSRRNLENILRRSDFDHLPYGNTKRYCPVIYLNHNSLMHGQSQYMVEYANRYYMMATQQAMEEFVNHPFKYVHDCFELIPPPFRGCVAGPCGLNRHLYASKLASKMNVPTATFTTLIREYIDKRDLTQEWLRTSYEDIYEKYCDDFLGNHVAQYFKDGFVFESFPVTSKQLKDMLRNHLYPEIIIILDGQSAHIEENLFNRYQHMWENKLIWVTNNYKRRVREEMVEEELEFNDVNGNGRGEEYNSEENGEESSIFDEKYYVEILASIQNHEKIFEEMQAKARKNVRKHIDDIKEVAKLAVEFNIPVIEVPLIMTRKKASVMYKAIGMLTQMKSRRTMFEHVHIIPLDMAEKMLQTGLCFYSHFKNFDPVDAYNLVPVNMHETLRRQNRLYVCLYRRLLYYLNGWDNLKEFYNNPKIYAKSENPFSVVVPMRMAIIGPPYSGVTTLCNRISQEFNMKVFTKEDLMSMMKKKYPCSDLARNDPETISSSKIFLESVQIVRNCTANGFIIDNYQMDPNDIITVAKHDTALHLVLVVDTKFDTVWRNWKYEYRRRRRLTYIDTLKELNALHVVFREHKKKLHAFTIDVPDIRLFNVVVVNKTRSKWEQWDEARSKIYICLREIGGYFKNLDTGTCFSLSHINVFWYEFQKRLSSLKVFCPVCLRLERRLKQFRYDYCPVGLKFYERKCQQIFNEPFGYNMESIYEIFSFPKWYVWNSEKKPLFTNNAFRRNLIQYREHFYWFCDKHCFDLTLHTEQYLPPDLLYLPLHVPFLVTNYFNINVEHGGNCIVTYQTNGIVVQGSREFSVYYRGKIFLCASAEYAIMLLEQPELYYNCNGFNDEDQYIDWDLREMSIDFGSLTPELIIEALIALNKERPKHYGLNIANSAAIYIALFLKCANPNSKLDVTKFYQKVMTNYVSDCGLIRSQLNKRQMDGNPYIKQVHELQKLE